MKLNELTPVFVEYIPLIKEFGILYISEIYSVSIHLCACGCGIQTVLPFNKEVSNSDKWLMINCDNKISFQPSIGNFSGENPYHAHYYITENRIIWC